MRKLFIVMLVLGFMSSMSACSNTFKGIGKDLQDLGKSIEGESSEDKSNE